MNTILVVDDSPTIRRMVRAALGPLGDVTFTEAGSGLRAIEVLGMEPVHMVVLDLNMPDMHGIDVIRFLRSHDRYRGLPVMVLTTRGDESSRKAALDAGASTYVTKPFLPSALLSSVRELLDSPVYEIAAGIVLLLLFGYGFSWFFALMGMVASSPESAQSVGFLAPLFEHRTPAITISDGPVALERQGVKLADDFLLLRGELRLPEQPLPGVRAE